MYSNHFCYFFRYKPFKVECKERKQLNERRNSSCPDGGGEVSSIGMEEDKVGLRLLTQMTNSKGTSNVLVQSALRKVNQNNHPLHFSFLKTCNLCNKQLSPDKDIYMYRGDEGFCSAECRNREIVLDEMREEERYRKQMAASYRHCWNDGSADSRNQTPPNQNHWAIVS